MNKPVIMTPKQVVFFWWSDAYPLIEDKIPANDPLAMRQAFFVYVERLYANSLIEMGVYLDFTIDLDNTLRLFGTY